jgi:Zn finger protein HypA/HybF involved in hydrogenase expression
MEIELTVWCDECAQRIGAKEKAYCAECHEALLKKISELEDEIADLKLELSSEK